MVPTRQAARDGRPVIALSRTDPAVDRRGCGSGCWTPWPRSGPAAPAARPGSDGSARPRRRLGACATGATATSISTEPRPSALTWASGAPSMTTTRLSVEVRDGRHQVRSTAGLLRAQRLHASPDRARVALVGQTALLLGGDEVGAGHRGRTGGDARAVRHRGNRRLPRAGKSGVVAHEHPAGAGSACQLRRRAVDPERRVGGEPHPDRRPRRGGRRPDCGRHWSSAGPAKSAVAWTRRRCSVVRGRSSVVSGSLWTPSSAAARACWPASGSSTRCWSWVPGRANTTRRYGHLSGAHDATAAPCRRRPT